MLRVFNMGIGMILAVDPVGLRDVLAALRAKGQRAYAIGTVQRGGSGVVYDLGPAEPASESPPSPPSSSAPPTPASPDSPSR
jgi:AIR synthase related protein, C-terminal domain